ncbi:hypothetical protein DJ75_14110 [Halorubrum sp. Eb13]|nr:glycosyltransferase [Halorubrum sp. Eb13]OYR41434.1 hypothetical protein DJ75_14110 [Halorubrum sp. Eb13]
MNPTISVIITTYYRNELLTEAIESILAQEYEPVELIVVDDSGVGHAEPVTERYDEVKGIAKEKTKAVARPEPPELKLQPVNTFNFLMTMIYR